MEIDDHRMIHVFSRNRDIFLLIRQFYIELFIDTIPVVNESFQLIDISAGNQKCQCAENNHGNQDCCRFQYTENDPCWQFSLRFVFVNVKV